MSHTKHLHFEDLRLVAESMSVSHEEAGDILRNSNFDIVEALHRQKHLAKGSHRATFSGLPSDGSGLHAPFSGEEVSDPYLEWLQQRLKSLEHDAEREREFAFSLQKDLEAEKLLVAEAANERSALEAHFERNVQKMREEHRNLQAELERERNQHKKSLDDLRCSIVADSEAYSKAVLEWQSSVEKLRKELEVEKKMKEQYRLDAAGLREKLAESMHLAANEEQNHASKAKNFSDQVSMLTLERDALHAEVQVTKSELEKHRALLTELHRELGQQREAMDQCLKNHQDETRSLHADIKAAKRAEESALALLKECQDREKREATANIAEMRATEMQKIEQMRAAEIQHLEEMREKAAQLQLQKTAFDERVSAQEAIVAQLHSELRIANEKIAETLFFKRLHEEGEKTIAILREEASTVRLSVDSLSAVAASSERYRERAESAEKSLSVALLEQSKMSSRMTFLEETLESERAQRVAACQALSDTEAKLTQSLQNGKLLEATSSLETATLSETVSQLRAAIVKLEEESAETKKTFHETTEMLQSQMERADTAVKSVDVLQFRLEQANQQKTALETKLMRQISDSAAIVAQQRHDIELQVQKFCEKEKDEQMLKEELQSRTMALQKCEASLEECRSLLHREREALHSTERDSAVREAEMGVLKERLAAVSSELGRTQDELAAVREEGRQMQVSSKEVLEGERLRFETTIAEKECALRSLRMDLEKVFAEEEAKKLMSAENHFSILTGMVKGLTALVEELTGQVEGQNMEEGKRKEFESEIKAELSGMKTLLCSLAEKGGDGGDTVNFSSNEMALKMMQQQLEESNRLLAQEQTSREKVSKSLAELVESRHEEQIETQRRIVSLSSQVAEFTATTKSLESMHRYLEECLSGEKEKYDAITKRLDEEKALSTSLERKIQETMEESVRVNGQLFIWESKYEELSKNSANAATMAERSLKDKNSEISRISDELQWKMTALQKCEASLEECRSLLHREREALHSTEHDSAVREAEMGVLKERLAAVSSELGRTQDELAAMREEGRQLQVSSKEVLERERLRFETTIAEKENELKSVRENLDQLRLKLDTVRTEEQLLVERSTVKLTTTLEVFLQKIASQKSLEESYHAVESQIALELAEIKEKISVKEEEERLEMGRSADKISAWELTLEIMQKEVDESNRLLSLERSGREAAASSLALLQDSRHKEVCETNERIVKLSAEVAELSSTSRALENARQNLEATLTAEREKLANAEAELLGVNSEIGNRIEEVRRLERELEEREGRLEKAQNEHDAIVRGVRQDLSIVKFRVEEAERSKDLQERTLRDEKEKNALLTEALSASRMHAAELKDQLANVQKNCAALEACSNDARQLSLDRLARLESDVERAEREREGAVEKCAALEQESMSRRIETELRIASLQHALDHCKAELAVRDAESEKHMEMVRKNAESVAERERSDLKQEIVRLQHENRGLQKTNGVLETLVKEQQAQITSLEEKLQQNGNLIHDSEKRIWELQMKVELSENKMKELESRYELMGAASATLREDRHREKHVLESQIHHLEMKESELRTQLQLSENKVKELESLSLTPGSGDTGWLKEKPLLENRIRHLEMREAELKTQLDEQKRHHLPAALRKVSGGEMHTLAVEPAKLKLRSNMPVKSDRSSR